MIGKISVSEILKWISGRVVNAETVGERVESIRITRPAVLEDAIESEVAFFFSRDYENELRATRAGVLITGEAFVSALQRSGLPLWSKSIVIACPEPYLAMGILSEKFASILESQRETEIHPTAIIHPTARLGPGVSLGPYCVVEKNVNIGSGSILYSGCHVGSSVRIGKDCVLFPHVVLYEGTELGDRVRIHAASVLGSDGFGYAPKKQGKVVIGHQKIFHLGKVKVGNDVEIGACCTVDRGTFGDTVIGDQAKLDNQVHLGHNSHVGEGAIICGGTGLAGGASLGRFSVIGGMAGISNRVHVGEGAQVGAFSLVTKDVPPQGTALGNPQREYHEHFRVHALLNRLNKAKRNGSTNGKDS